jgi:hypothetical protein
MSSPGQILTDWRADAGAILIAFLPGEQYGNAIADIIFGNAIPQVLLSFPFPPSYSFLNCFTFLYRTSCRTSSRILVGMRNMRSLSFCRIQ